MGLLVKMVAHHIPWKFFGNGISRAYKNSVSLFKGLDLLNIYDTFIFHHGRSEPYC
jgi:hypothetical protein